MRIVYSPKYYANIGSHVFPMEKYRLVVEKLLNNGIILKRDIVQPSLINDEDLLLVHSPLYLDKLKRQALSHSEIQTLELPYSRELFDAFRYSCSGTTQAGRYSLKDGIGINIGGGFHHAFPDHGEGFCMLNDIAVCIKVLLKEKMIKRALVFDCDLHQGNGTAHIFKHTSSVFTYSIHQENIYPIIKEKSSLDVGLPLNVGDDEYLIRIEEDFTKILKGFMPDFIIYVAGADPYEKDQLGALKITMEGLKRRDEIILEHAKEKRVPITIVLGGGYAYKLEDTVQIHYNTIKKAIDIFF